MKTLLTYRKYLKQNNFYFNLISKKVDHTISKFLDDHFLKFFLPQLTTDDLHFSAGDLKQEVV